METHDKQAQTDIHTHKQTHQTNTNRQINRHTEQIGTPNKHKQTNNKQTDRKTDRRNKNGQTDKQTHTNKQRQNLRQETLLKENGRDLQ